MLFTYLAILMFVIGIGLGIYFAATQDPIQPSDFFTAPVMFGVLSGFIGLVCLGLLSLILTAVNPSKLEYSYNFPIKASSDGSAVSGRFGIFSGYIKEEQYYYFYRQDGKFITQGHILASKTRIVETNELPPHISVYEDSRLDDDLFYWLVFSEDTEYIIYVPENSVIGQHRYDLGD